MLECGSQEVIVESGDDSETRTALTKSLVRKSIPFVIGVLFLIFIGGGI